MLPKIKNMITYNFKTLLGFELIYKLLSTVIFMPLFYAMFHLITQIRGYAYLTLENIGSFLLHPLTLFLLIILLVFLTFYTFLDISTIIIILDSSYQQRKITIKEAFILAVEKSLRVFHKKNIFMPFLVIFLIPFLNIGISSSFISTISVPEFILDFINHNSLLSVLYALLLIGLAILLFRWLYVLHYFVLENCDFKEARKKSINLSKKEKLKDFILICLTQLGITLIYFVFILVGIFIIVLLYKLFSKTNILSTLSITFIWLLIAISFVLVVLLATPISYAIISIRFYYHKEKKKERIVHLKLKNKIKDKEVHNYKIFKYVVITLAFGGAAIFTSLVMRGKLNLNVEYVRMMEVTAHRGASVSYPENTMSAFRGAKELGADWIELDVQQTKDGKLIILHDTNLKRTTGVNKDTWDVTYEEIKDLDAGSFFDKKFAGEKIPLLEEVIQYAKAENMRLNIELKPTGKEVDFEKSVVDVILENDFANNCVVTSQVYRVLENVKKYNSDIKTVYVMSFAYGNILELAAADSFSIEASSITKTLVKNIHNNGKEVYAWTVNTQDSITKMVNLNVDNIITDNITLAKDIVYTSKTSDLIQEYVKAVNQLLA